MVVDGDVCVGAEEAEAAVGFHGHAAGGEVGDAAALEGEAGVADVFDLADDADADGVDF